MLRKRVTGYLHDSSYVADSIGSRTEAESVLARLDGALVTKDSDNIVMYSKDSERVKFYFYALIRGIDVLPDMKLRIENRFYKIIHVEHLNSFNYKLHLEGLW
jgi:hypothetical protein